MFSYFPFFAVINNFPQGYGVYIFFATMMVLSIPFLYLLLPETKNVPLYVFSSILSASTCYNVHSYSEEMDRLFAPGLKPWRAYDVVMADVRAVHNSDVYARTASIDSEEKGVGSVEHHEKISANGV
jgi:hypothetical protein